MVRSGQEIEPWTEEVKGRSRVSPGWKSHEQGHAQPNPRDGNTLLPSAFPFHSGVQ